MIETLTGKMITAKSICPNCWKQNRLNLMALSDSDHRIYSKWLVCGHCGWDERAALSPASANEGEK
jgi:Zn ribbon nucleic-acid-binding protein